ncbi:MAG: lactate racemase domain-containing protein [Chloroflexaceae bacterium]|jgi:nickel-dependent lactate racemase|nr:lactate racemase domain-containing protein [Chloroflexaceae bacterium]
MIVGAGSAMQTLSDAQVAGLLAEGLGPLALDGRRVLVIIPDATRTAPIPLLFHTLCATLASRVQRLDFLIALGTHPPMDEAAIDKLVGMPAPERVARFANVAVLNHAWDCPEELATLGTLPADELARRTGGLLARPTPVRVNRAIFNYDQLLLCGPVFPHEVAGFSGGAKYLFPGIAGPEIIDATHWLGALGTSIATIGVKDTAVRRVIHMAAGLVPVPMCCIALVLKGTALHGLYIGPHEQAWSAAADLSAQLNIVWKPRPFQRVLALAAPKYADLWTAAKAMYKTEPVVADGGEVIIYAPHISEVSYTHGQLIDRVGYHVRDYFVGQWERFGHLPGGVLAHSTHVKGHGSYDSATGVETPRITVTLATAIPEERCRRINLGYCDYRTLDPAAWAGREDDGLLLVEHAGEVLYRLGER